MDYTLDTKVAEILDDTRAVEILERYSPASPKIPLSRLQKE